MDTCKNGEKSPKDFKVRTITDIESRHYCTPKHAHFAVDFYGKLCQNKEMARKVFDAIVRVWNGEDVKEVIGKSVLQIKGMVGYDLDYILYALKWIFDQEDINFVGRPSKLQEKLDEKCQKMGINVPRGREGSQLAITLFCDIASGVHPVEALLNANLDIVPRFARR